MPDSEKQTRTKGWHDPIIPLARWPREPWASQQRRGYIPHLVALVGALVGTVLLIAAYIPTAFVSLPSAPWMFIVHRPFEVAGKRLEDAAVKAIPRYGVSMFKICRWSRLPEDLVQVDDSACVAAPWVFSGDLKGIDKGEGLILSE